MQPWVPVCGRRKATTTGMYRGCITKVVGGTGVDAAMGSCVWKKEGREAGV